MNLDVRFSKVYFVFINEISKVWKEEETRRKGYFYLFLKMN